MIDQDARREVHGEEATTTWIFNDVRLSTRVMPARLAALGGDWCEAFALSENVVALSIGDVCGHGVDAFSTMTQVRQVVRDAAWAGLDPGEVLTVANRFVNTLDPECLTTALFALLDTNLRTCTFANAGHPAPLVVGAAQPMFLTYDDSDVALGIEPVLTPNLRAATLLPGALLVFYTDGVIERDRDLVRGEDELRAAAHVARNFGFLSAASTIDELLHLSGSNPDDAAILTVSIPRTQRRAELKRRPRSRLHAVETRARK